MTITIYSNDYDKKDHISDGYSGRVFLDPSTRDQMGIEFGKNLSEALKTIVEKNIIIDNIVFCYRDGDNQLFKRFNCKI